MSKGDVGVFKTRQGRTFHPVLLLILLFPQVERFTGWIRIGVQME